jgi:iron only hydrogenase large subunit-like protein
MGSLVKDHLAQKVLHISPSSIYHVSIMPCYDKKLEASRQDFYNDLYSTRDVDLVLSSSEIETIMNEKSISFQSLPFEMNQMSLYLFFYNIDI